MGRLGLGFLGFPDLRSMIRLGQQAETAGFESAWVSETRITRDAVTGVTALLLGTERLRVGSAAINVFTRGAALAAVTWATLDEAAPGRVVLGLGVGSEVPLAQQGYEVQRPLTRLREFTEAVRAAWEHPVPVEYRGRHTRYVGLMPEVRPASSPPIYWCVAGPRALETAARMANGVIFDAFLTPSYASRARERLDRAAGGHYQGEIGAGLVVSLADSVAEAAAPLRPVLARYLVHFPELARETGLDPEFVERLRALAERDGIEATYPELPDSLVAQHAVCGSPAVCRDRIAEYRAAGVQLPILFPGPESIARAIEELAGA